MSRLHKTLNVEGSDGEMISVTVHELTVGQIIDLMNEEMSVDKAKSSIDFRKFIENNIQKFTTLSFENMKGMAPSELKKVYLAFKEVNETFFEVAREAGLLGLLNELKIAMVEDFSRLLVGSLRQATVRLSSTMDTPSS